MDIEEDIEKVKKLNNLLKFFKTHGWIPNMSRNININGTIEVIEHILAERKVDKKKIEELEEKNKEILNSKIGIDLSYNDYIPKQKIKEKIKDLEYNSSLGFEETLEESYKIEVLKELLEDK